jgi:hypothetical protein
MFTVRGCGSEFIGLGMKETQNCERNSLKELPVWLFEKHHGVTGKSVE